jgi:hypothetical protein
MSVNENNIALQISDLMDMLVPDNYNIRKVINKNNMNIQLTDSLERLISKYTWERFIAEYIASKLFLLHLPIDEDINIEDIDDVIDRFDVVETFRGMYPAAEVNERVISLVEPSLNKLKLAKIAPVNAIAIPSGSSVFQGQAVQANLIGDNDNGYIDATYKPGKKNTLHKRLTSMFGMTSKKPIATPVGGKRKTKKTKKDKKTRRHRKKRV